MSQSGRKSNNNNKALALLASINADRDDFNKKKKELEAEMAASKNGMRRIQAGLKNNEIDQELIQSGTEHLSSPANTANKKHSTTPSTGRKSVATVSPSTRASLFSPTSAAAGASGGTGADALNPPIVIPNGARISDWVYTGAIDSTPPVVKTMDIYEIVRFLGRGAFGDVNLIKNLENNVLYADKAIYVEKEESMPFFLEELKFIRLHRHPCIIDVQDGFIIAQPRVLHIIMPYGEGGDMAKYISTQKKNNSKIPESQIIKWTMQIALALHFLHESGAIHRDLKPSNVMLTEGGELIKLVDFGLAYKFKDGDFCNSATEVGTPYYTPPEMIEGKPYSYPSDCWSFGVLLYELLTFHLPFRGKETTDLVKSILTEATPSLPQNFSQETRNICYGLLNKDPNKRLGMAGLLTSSTFNPRVVSFPQSYRPKSLEERVKRIQVRQLTAQVEMLNFSKKSSIMSVLECLPVVDESINENTLPSIGKEEMVSPNSPKPSPRGTPKVSQNKKLEATVTLPLIKATNSPSQSQEQATDIDQPPPNPESVSKFVATPPPVQKQGSSARIATVAPTVDQEDANIENINSKSDESVSNHGGKIGNKIATAIQEAQALVNDVDEAKGLIVNDVDDTIEKENIEANVNEIDEDAKKVEEVIDMLEVVEEVIDMIEVVENKEISHSSNDN